MNGTDRPRGFSAAVVFLPHLDPYREWAARVALEAGLQPIRLRCRYGGGRSTPSLSVKYEGPGVAKQTVPASALFHAAV